MRKKCCLALITFSMRGDFMNTKLLTSILQSSNDLITSEDFLRECETFSVNNVLEGLLW